MNPSRISDKTLLGKVIRLPLRLVPAGAVVRIVPGPARGRRWVSNCAAHGYWLGYWELEPQRWLAAHLKPGDVVYDIGAHVGLCGGQRTLAEFTPRIFLFCYSQHESRRCCELLSSLGYPFEQAVSDAIWAEKKG